MNEFLVTASDSGKRIDVYLSEQTEQTRSAIKRMLEEDVTVNGKNVKPNYKVKENDSIEVEERMPEPTDVMPENIPLDIVYEDESVMVINKERGMVVHPAAGNPTGTLVNAILYHAGDHLSGIGGAIRPGIVHRIDKDTTGLLAVAKNDAAHLALSAQLSDRTLSREYLALVHGNIKEDTGRVDAPIGRHPKDRKKMAVVHDGREAITDYFVEERFMQYTLVRCKLHTGRTHQIRVHMSHIGHPIVGDPVYGVRNEAFSLNGQLLHAEHISFVHPETKACMSFSAPLPEDFCHVLEVLRKRNR